MFIEIKYLKFLRKSSCFKIYESMAVYLIGAPRGMIVIDSSSKAVYEVIAISIIIQEEISMKR